MNEKDIRRISNGLKHAPGYVFEGKLAKFKMVHVKVKGGRLAVYLVVWLNRDGEPIFLNLLPAGKWNEALMQELIDSIKNAIQVNNEQAMLKQLNDAAQFIISLTKEQNAEDN